MSNQVVDTRPSFFGGYNFTLTPEQQKRALRLFKKFYMEQSQKLVWSGEKSIYQYGNQRDYLESKIASLKNIRDNSMENCVGFAHLLHDKLEKLGLPAVVIWVARDTKEQANIGHCLVAYRCNGKNYCADLCSATHGCEHLRGKQSFMFAEPMEQHLSAYMRSGFVGVQYGGDTFSLNFFKEFDDIRGFMKRPVRLTDYKRLPFFNKEYCSFKKRETYIHKMSLDFRPVDFSKVGLSGVKYDLANYNAPPELVSACGRQYVYDSNNTLHNLIVSSENGTIKRRKPTPLKRKTSNSQKTVTQNDILVENFCRATIKHIQELAKIPENTENSRMLTKLKEKLTQ